MIPIGYRENFGTLQRAMANGSVALVECNDAKTGRPVYTLCAVSKDRKGNVTLAPLAKMFDGNPYEELTPPPPQTRNGG